MFPGLSAGLGRASVGPEGKTLNPQNAPGLPDKWPDPAHRPQASLSPHTYVSKGEEAGIREKKHYNVPVLRQRANKASFHQHFWTLSQWRVGVFPGSDPRQVAQRTALLPHEASWPEPGQLRHDKPSLSLCRHGLPMEGWGGAAF